MENNLSIANSNSHDNFSVLLQQGRIADAIECRIDSLEKEAHEFKLDTETAKLLSATLGIVGTALSASPLIAVVGGLGALGYGWMVLTDYRRTKRLMPVPCLRKDVMELFADIATHTDTKQVQSHHTDDPMEDVISCLTPAEATEYQLLMLAGDQMVGFLKQIPTESRAAAYRYAMRQVMIRQSLPSVQEAIAAVDAVALPAQVSPPLPSSDQPVAPVEKPEQQASDRPPIGSNTRLRAVEVPSQQVQQWDEDEPVTAEGSVSNESADYAWMGELLAYPSILIYGAPGSGKSTLADWLIRKRLDLGHQVEILDPHRSYGQWDGLQVYGDGMDYASIDRRLAAFASLVKARYQQRASKPSFNPRPHTVLCEEFTQWSKKCDHAPEFFEITVSDIRKINCHAVYVSHNRTLTAMGGSRGLAATRDSALLEVELLAQVDPLTGKAVPTGKGRLKYPGGQTIEITVPKLAIAPTALPPEPEPEPTQQTSQQFNDRMLLEFGMSPQQMTEYLEWKQRASVSENLVNTPDIAPTIQPPEQKTSLYDELAKDFDETNEMPLMGDFIRWLKTKRNDVISKRNAILLWGNKKDRGVTSNEAIEPFLREAIELGLLKETQDGYRVIDT